MSLGAEQIRTRISNAFGINSLPVTAVTVALPYNGSAGTSAIQPQTLQAVTFSGATSFTVPDGALAVSNPLDFPIKPQSMLTITVYLAQGQQGFSITSHPGSRTTSWFSVGNFVNATNLTDSSTQNVAHWSMFILLRPLFDPSMTNEMPFRYFVSAIEAWTPPGSRAFAIVGDSITDGRGSDTDSNDRYALSGFLF